MRPLFFVILTVSTSMACAPPPGNRLRIGTDVPAGSLDPRLMRDTTSYRVVDLLYDGLVRLDHDGNPQPALAVSWERPEPTVWVFHLREDARFHDGSDVVADDVVHTFETLRDPNLNAPLRSLYEPIDEVVAENDATLVVRLSEPYAPLLSYLDVGIVSRTSTDDVGLEPMGTGPYRLRAWERGSRIVLEANPDHWGGRPAIDVVEFVVVPDNTARAQAFEAGDLDLVQSPLAPLDISRLTSDERFVSHVTRSPAMTYFNFNTARSALGDARTRRAIAHLIDADTILAEIYEGIDEPAGSILLPGWRVDGDEVRQPTFDPEEARALFDAAGWRDDDGDGVRERDGVPLAVELGTHGEDLNRVQTVEYVQNVFQRHGIAAELRVSDWASFSARRDSGEFDIILLGWTQLVDPDRGTFDQFHSEGGLNWGSFRDPRMDELLSMGRRETEQTERNRIYREVAEVVATEVPYYVLSFQRHHVFHSKRLLEFAPDSRGRVRSVSRARLDAQTRAPD
jgi:peptide/nickel transport system substrate-binding protein